MTILKSIQRTPFEWVEIDQDLCANVYGSAPCAAILGTTGADKCYNTRASCQDPTNYDGTDTLTLRFCANRGQIPDDYYYLPYLQGATVSAAKINPGGGNENMAALGTRATLTVNFSDHPHTDRNVDPYLSDRDFIAFERSTFWAKWRARNPYYMHRVIRHKSGFIDPDTMLPDPATLITRTFFITGFSGPDNDGNVTIKAQDLLTLAANEKAKAPAASTGKLLVAINDTDLAATLTPAGIGNLEYPASGKVRIDGEVISFTRVADALTIVRARNNTTAAAHDINASVQLCLEYSSDSPADILQDLLVNYANVPVGYLDTAQWATESADFLPRLYSAIITEPTGVTELIGEMCEQMYFTTFWDERTALLKLRAVRPAENETITYLNDDANILEDSITWTDRPDQLITQVWVYYAQKNPTDSTTDARNFGAIDVIADPDAEGSDRNAVAKIKRIYSRWMQGTDGAAAIELGQKILDRYNEIPKECTFSVDAKDRDLWLADFINMTNRNLVDFTGAARSIPMQIVSAQESLQGTVYSYQAIEYSGDSEITAPGEYTVNISTDQTNINLRTLFDSLYAVTLVSGDKVRFTIRAGVTIGSRCSDAAFPAYTANLRHVKSISSSGFPTYISTYSFETRPLILPYISRHDIVADTDYAVGDTYTDPDTGTPTTWFCSATTKERPAATAITSGSWPAGVEIYLDIEPGAMVLGEGGCGGTHPLHEIYTTVSTGIYSDDTSKNNAVRAGDGGHALELTYPITINNRGLIAGGGGGGDFALNNYNDINNIESTIVFVPHVFVPGGAGAGYRGGLRTDIYLRSNVGEFNLPVSGVTYTQPADSLKESYGEAGYLKLQTTGYQYISGVGGELAESGGAGFKDLIFASTITYNKPGRAGFAVKDGVELITWVQKGDVRGAEY